MKYKDVMMEEAPEYNPETQYLVENYEETDDTITVHWDILNINDTATEDASEVVEDGDEV